MSELLAKRDYNVGLNCWNAAFYVKGLYPFPLQLSQIQATNMFESNCRKLEVTAKDAPVGSVLRITRADGVEVHAAIKIGDDRYFQKRGYLDERIEPYEIVPMSKLDIFYACGVSAKCPNIKSFYSCSPSTMPQDPLNPLEIKIQALGRTVSNLSLDAQNRRETLAAINLASDQLDGLYRSPDLDSWIYGASKTNLLMLSDIIAALGARADREKMEAQPDLYLVMNKPLSASLRMYARASRIRYFDEYEKSYFEMYRDLFVKWNIKL